VRNASPGPGTLRRHRPGRRGRPRLDGGFVVLGSGSGGGLERRQPGPPRRPGIGGSCRSGLHSIVHSHRDQPIVGGDRVGARRPGGRAVQHLAGTDIEAGAVPRAAQHAVVYEVTLAQGAALMGALVVEGVPAALAVDDGHPAARPGQP
jgi:hypothetical protein